MSIFKQINLNQVKRYSVRNRKHKVSVKDLVFFNEKYRPKKLNKEFQELINLIKKARENKKAIVFGMGGHVIKTGMGPLLIKLLENNFITCSAGNGAVAIHDFELSAFGKTSEYVENNLPKGRFGFVKETAQLFFKALKPNLGLGESLGKFMQDNPKLFPNRDISVLYNAYKNKVPMTIHTAIGAETIYQHPECDGRLMGGLSFRDFKIFANQLLNLGNGGVYLNLGSAVIMPEVFLKALTVAKNINPKVKNFYTANFDMIDHYRPRENVINRPTLDGGKGFSFIGRHEEQIPMLIYALLAYFL
ncbi:MAG: hypothetical protein ABIG90_02065 [bacterium]